MSVRAFGIGLLAGAALATFVCLAVQGGVPPPPSSPAIDAPGRPDAPPTATAEAARLDGIEQRLQALTELVARLDQRLASTAPEPATRSAVEPERLLVDLDEAALVRALQRAQERRETQRLEKMSDEELLTEARRTGNQDFGAARAALRAMLARSLSPEKRAEALTQLGIVDRQAGDFAASERSLQEVVDSNGMQTEAGAWAAYQLVWTANNAGRTERALELANAVADSPQSNESLRIHGMWMAACLTDDLGRSNQARIKLQAVLDRCGEQTAFAGIAADVKRRLDTLR